MKRILFAALVGVSISGLAYAQSYDGSRSSSMGGPATSSVGSSNADYGTGTGAMTPVSPNTSDMDQPAGSGMSGSQTGTDLNGPGTGMSGSDTTLQGSSPSNTPSGSPSGTSTYGSGSSDMNGSTGLDTNSSVNGSGSGLGDVGNPAPTTSDMSGVSGAQTPTSQPGVNR